MKNKFTKLAVLMSVVLTLMGSISVASMACLFCDETVEEEYEEVIPEEPIIPDTDAE